MDSEILKYNEKQEPNYKEVCELLAEEIDKNLPRAESKIWHAHPVWSLDGTQQSDTASRNQTFD